MLAAHENGENSADFAQALALFDANAQRLKRLLRETERDLAAHCREIEAVAMALLERSVLSAMDLYKITVRAPLSVKKCFHAR
jgi:hypothetical protein